MERIKRIGHALLYPHAAVLLLLVPLSTALLVYAMVYLGSVHFISCAVYVLSAYTLTAVCVRIPAVIRFFNTVGRDNRYVYRFLADAQTRVSVSLYGSLAINTAYAVFQLGLGFYHASVWFYTLAVYYILLAVMRFFLLRHTRAYTQGENMKKELQRYRFCGIMLAIMHLFLAMIVFYITWQNRTFRHHEITTIAMAAYTFTAFTLAIVNAVKYRKYQSPVFSAAKAIGLAAALVSMLTLESAMLTAFGTQETAAFNQLMTGITGTVVVLFVLCLAIYMIVRSTEQLQQLRSECDGKSSK